VVRDQGGDVHVGDAVAVGEADGLVVGEVAAHPGQTAAGKGGFTGVYQGDLPGFGLLAAHFHVIEIHIEGDITGVQEIVGEVFLDHITLVATTDDEVVDAVVAVNLEDVPQDRLAADLHHRLGPQVGLLRKPGTKSTGQDDGFHQEEK